ncbi:MAG: lmo0937 family membrane protein, partial [Sulfurimonas sp.]|uniref:lmo0937 family membrane protein n=1 Tax=Sulfurimonas sp. TaxID=2022749 RepID=UPI0028CE5300
RTHNHILTIWLINILYEGVIMIEIIAIVLVVLWLLGLVTSHTLGGFIHILLVIAVVVILVRVIQGRRL